MLLLRQGPLNFIHGLSRQFGPVARFQVGWHRYYVLSDPAHVRHVLQERMENYSKETHDYWLLKRMLGHSLLTGDGPLWQQRRRLIQPAFHRQQMEHLAEKTVACTDGLFANWEAKAHSGVAFNVVEDMVQLTLRIIGQALFSTDLIDEAPAVGRAVHRINHTAGWNADTLASLIPVLNWPHLRAAGVLDTLISDLIQQRRSSREWPVDLLTSLINARDEETGQPLTNREIRNEALTLLLAGHDTSAHHLAWSLFLLAQQASVVSEWHTELDQVLGARAPRLADLPQLPHTRRIVDESLRLFPPIWAIPRRALKDDVIGGYDIPAGSYVLLPIYSLQRDAQWWSDPETFRPSRFDRQQEAPPPAGAYAPFGWGPRTCVAAQFAIVESQLVLARLAQRFTWSLDPAHEVSPEGLITLQPKHGIRIRLQLRPTSQAHSVDMAPLNRPPAQE